MYSTSQGFSHGKNEWNILWNTLKTSENYTNVGLGIVNKELNDSIPHVNKC